MTTEDFFTYLRRNPATIELAQGLAQIVEERSALAELARRMDDSQAA